MASESPYKAREWQSLRKWVLNRAGYVCHWCGARANSADHLQPVMEGGRNVLSNLVAACTSCQSARRNARIAVLARRAVAAGLHLSDTATGGGAPPPRRAPTGRKRGRPSNVERVLGYAPDPTPAPLNNRRVWK